MRPFDMRFVEDTMALVRSLPPDKKPLWGMMTVPQMLGHLTHAVRYSLGLVPPTKNETNFFRHYVVRPLILYRIVRMPKNVQAPPMYENAEAHGTPESFETVLRLFVQRYNDPDFEAPENPYFGSIGKEGWARLHMIHIEHHLRQFGVAPKDFLDR
jgi:hypothetical protein